MCRSVKNSITGAEVDSSKSKKMEYFAALENKKFENCVDIAEC
jgi:hypothetical protein